MSSESPEVHGRCEPAFESLRQALAEIIGAGSEVGAALVVHGGRQPVVDLSFSTSDDRLRGMFAVTGGSNPPRS